MKPILSKLIYSDQITCQRVNVISHREAVSRFRKWPAQYSLFFHVDRDALGKVRSTTNWLKLFKWAPWSISLFYVLQFPHPIILNVSSLRGAASLPQRGGSLCFRQLALKVGNRSFLSCSGARFFLLVTIKPKISIKGPRANCKYLSSTSLC